MRCAALTGCGGPLLFVPSVGTIDVLPALFCSQVVGGLVGAGIEVIRVSNKRAALRLSIL